MQLREIHDRVAAAGVCTVVVGNGTAWQAAALRDEMGLQFVLLVDPGLRSYRVAGLRRGWTRILDPRLLLATWRAWRSGARQTTLQGDPWQLGGLLLFDHGGRLRARQRSAYPGDHWSALRILTLLETSGASKQAKPPN